MALDKNRRILPTDNLDSTKNFERISIKFSPPLFPAQAIKVKFGEKLMYTF